MTMINRLISRVLPYMPKKLVWLFSKKYIAGETVSDALRESKKLNNSGVKVTIDVLGEYIDDLKQANRYKEEYLKLLKDFFDSGIDGFFSLKPSMFGLLLDKEECYNNIREIVNFANKNNSFIRIDMEDSSCTDDELNIYLRIKKEFPGSVGIVLQSYLKRTLSDLKNLKRSVNGSGMLNVRLCKGIYVEPEDIAYKRRKKIRELYIEEMEYMFKNKVFIGIATHDRYLVENALRLIEKYNVKKDMYEFQMLFGVTPELRNELVRDGHPMRVYVPYGKDWFGYSTRRLKENPAIASYIIKALFVKG